MSIEHPCERSQCAEESEQDTILDPRRKSTCVDRPSGTMRIITKWDRNLTP